MEPSPPGSASEDIQQRAERVFVAGISHNGRFRSPARPRFAKGAGCRKWDTDGKEYIDYAQGHGALILGIGHQATREAVERALAAGSHLGGNNEQEVYWGEAVQALVPSAELVRFTGSGTEASLLAMRIARAFTGRPRIAKLGGHFHGWHDYATLESRPPFDRAAEVGVPTSAMDSVATLWGSPDELVEQTRSGNYAALVIEPTGPSWGTSLLDRATIARLMDAAADVGTLVIFDEVVTGFRLSPGGFQAASGLVPDLTILAKILAGGLPGGAVAGRADCLELLNPARSQGRGIPNHIHHPGTFNGNPLSAAAGRATLNEIADGSILHRAAEVAAELRDRLNEVFRFSGVPFLAYGTSSYFHVTLDADVALDDVVAAKSQDAQLVGRLDAALLDRGVDTLRLGGFVGAQHDDSAVEHTVTAYREAITSVSSR